MPHRIYILSLLFSPFLLAAQIVSNNGRFAVDFDRGCVPFEINVTELDAFGNITRQYFYEDGATETTSTTYTYNVADTFRIVQVVGIDVTPKTDTLFVIAVDPTETNFSVEKCNLNGVSITSEEQIYDFIRVYFTPADSVSLLSGESASYNYPANTTQSFQTKGFYTNAKENCTTFDHTVNPLPSLTTPDILSASVSETCLNHFVLVAEIQNYDSLVNYQVVFEQSNSVVIYEGKLDSTILVFSGISYEKTESQYCVKINAVDICTADIMEGAQFCQDITEFSSTPFENLHSGYTESGIFINVDSVLSGELLAYRKFGADGDFELRQTAQNAFTDPAGSLSREYFYRIDYLDTCGQVLFSAETNPPLLNSSRQEENTYQISFTSPVNFLSGLSSISYELGNETTTSESIPDEQFEISLNPENGTRQFLQARAEYNDGTVLLSNQITYKYKPIIYVPTAFTPNGDGLNDTLELFGLPTESATISIYTRWGQLIFTSNEPSPGWDGFIAGDPAPEGVYLYEVIFDDSDGVKVTQKGTFALIKK
ncbi:MAG: gliding motility-associated C-terminal domain-containing protein [Cyclobacteriaceae bacterium]